jgi:transglutaminase-like putative cysteine protease
MKTIFLPLLLSICSLVTIQTLAQSGPYKYGKVEEEELRMRIYDKDTSAVAVVLSDHGVSHFSFGGSTKLIFERRTRIKILKKSGYDWANIEVPVYQNGSRKETVSAVKGYTYNLENGKISKEKLEQSAVFEEQQSENRRSKKFTMPNVKEGSVIEYSYTITSDFIYNLREWEFQTTIPTVWSEYRAKIPQYFDYKTLQHGYQKLYQPQDKYDSNINGYRWVMVDLPALRPERYITTLSDYQSKIEFELQMLRVPGKDAQVMTGDWGQVIQELLREERFGSQLNRKGYFKQDIAAIVEKHSQPAEQVQAIYSLVQKNMRWNGKYGIYTTGSLRKAFENKTGSAAEINLLLTAMLQEAGLTAAPVLVSTREHGKIYKGTPLLNKFNYVIAHVNVGGKELLLDATDPMLPAGMLPVRCLNGEGRLVAPKVDRWIALKPSGLYQKYYAGNLVVNERGQVQGEATETSSGYSAMYLRKEILDEGEDKYTEKLNREVGDYKISKPSFSHLHDLASSLELKYQVLAAGSQQPADVIYLNPMMGHGEKENPFKLEKRAYPVDFAVPISETFVCRFTIPENYELEESPKNVKVTLPDKGGSFIFVVGREGNVIEVLSKIDIAKPVYYAEEYPYIKELYAQIVAKHAEKIVLKRK